MFLREIKRAKRSAKPQWLLLRDFNMIYREQGKRNGRLNRRLMSRFRRVLNFIEVKEIELLGRNFTWSNNISNPTLTRIDRMFYTPAWEELFLNLIIQALSPSSSYHYPLVIMPLNHPATRPIFRFESFWPSKLGFLDFVQAAWNKEIPQG
jgi:hypothetical protein